MKSAARILLAIALLLPFRGGLAAAGALCHAGKMTPHASTQAHAEHQHPTAGHVADETRARDAAASDPPFVAAPDQDEGMQPAHAVGDGANDLTTCDLCSSICASPPLPASDVRPAPLLPAGSERFLPLTSPRSRPVCGGLERPPRSA